MVPFFCKIVQFWILKHTILNVRIGNLLVLNELICNYSMNVFNLIFDTFELAWNCSIYNISMWNIRRAVKKFDTFSRFARLYSNPLKSRDWHYKLNKQKWFLNPTQIRKASIDVLNISWRSSFTPCKIN